MTFDGTLNVSTCIKVKTGDTIICKFQCGEPDPTRTEVYTIYGARTQRSLNA